MSRSPISVDADAGISSAALLMRLNRFTHLPVTRNGELVGIVSERDLLAVHAVRGGGGELLRVEDVARTDFYAVPPGTALREIVFEMVKKEAGSAVVFEGKEITGIFTALDAMRALSDLLVRERVG